MTLVRIRSRVSPRNTQEIPPVQGGPFQLPSGHFIPAKMPLSAIYPKPDTDTQSIAFHRLLHTQMDVKLPIGVQGGAWPFKYEIVTAPTGATIGETYGSTDYGVFRCPAQSSGTHNFDVKVTDQDGTIVNLTWSATVDDAAFVFIDSNVVSSGTGTFASPLKLFSDWYLDSNDDTTYVHLAAVFKAGTYTALGDGGTNVTLQPDKKTPTMVAFPDATVTIDCSACVMNTNQYEDVTILGINWENARATVANPHFWWLKNKVHRATFAFNTFDGLGNGTSGTDNPCGIFISNTNIAKTNVLIKQNTFQNFVNNGTNGSLVDMYATSNVLLEENTAKDNSSTYGWWMKNTTAFVSVRANTAVDNVTGRGITIGYGTLTLTDPHDHEVCWNNVKVTGSQQSLLFAEHSANFEVSYNSYIYRNTFSDISPWIRFNGIEDFETDANIVISDDLTNWNTSLMTTVLADLTGSTSSGIIDANNLLTGASRVTYLGEKGHEVSS